MHVFAEYVCLILHCYQCDINPFRPHSAILSTLGSYVIIIYNETDIYTLNEQMQHNLCQAFYLIVL